MPATYDAQGKYVLPEGFDPDAMEWLEGHDREREEWEKRYAAARALFDAHRKLFGISGYDLTVTVPVTFTELILGATIKIWPLCSRPITTKITPGTPSGGILRVKGLGAPLPDGPGSGDLLVTLNARIPMPKTFGASGIELAEKLNKLYNADRLRAELFRFPPQDGRSRRFRGSGLPWKPATGRYSG